MTIIDSKKVKFLVPKVENFSPSEVKGIKRTRNSAAVMSRFLCVLVRTMGSGIGTLYLLFVFACVLVLVLSYVCEQVVCIRIVLSSYS